MPAQVGRNAGIDGQQPSCEGLPNRARDAEAVQQQEWRRVGLDDPADVQLHTSAVCRELLPLHFQSSAATAGRLGTTASGLTLEVRSSAAVVTPVSTRMVCNPARWPPTTSVSRRSPIITACSGFSPPSLWRPCSNS